MSSIARTSTEFSDDRVEDEQFHVHNNSDSSSSSSSSSSVSSTSLVPSAGLTGLEDRPLVADARVEHSNNAGGRSVLETERDEHCPSTTGEREEQHYADDSQSSASTEDGDRDEDDDSTLVGDVGNGNRPERDTEHRRLSVVEVNYEDIPTPGLSVGNNEDDSSSEVAIGYDGDEEEGPVAIEDSQVAINRDSDEDVGPLAIEDVEDGRPLVSYLGVIVPVYRQHRKRTRLELEEDEDGSASRTPAAGPSSADAYRGPVNVSTDAQRAIKRPRQSRIPNACVEQGNLAFRLRQSDFGGFSERIRRPLRVRTEDAYASGSRSSATVRLGPDHASLLGAPTPAPSPSGERSFEYDYADDYADEREEEEYKDEDEQHDADDEREVEELGEKHDDDLVTQLPVTVVEGGEDNNDHGEDVGAVTDEF